MPAGFMNANKGKFIVEGFCKANTKITLYQNDKKIGTTKTNKEGYFVFKKLKRADKPSWLVIYNNKGNKGLQLSEKTRATFSKNELKTEFDIIHMK